jgi:hypothetical protein
LHEFLEEDVYICQPPGYEDKALPNYICMLDKELYGLKQALRAWYARLSAKLLQLAFKISKSDNSLFYFQSDDVTIFMLVYIDDIIVTSSEPHVVATLLKRLSDDFALKDLRDLHYFLGIEVKRVANGIVPSQEKYSNDLLKRVSMSLCKPDSNPLASRGKLASYIGTPIG